jgi:farnesyl-diphosphate farnesyltransferase
MIDTADLQTLLAKTSRTFALSIPMLPERLREEIGVAYLLFRILDTFEDATGWPVGKRRDALAELVLLLAENAPDGKAAAARWRKDSPIEHAGYLELLEATPRVLAWFGHLAPAAREQMRSHIARSARGMGDFLVRGDAAGGLQLETVQELRDYCYFVAGVVGEMLTELFLLAQPQLQGAAGALRERSVGFGEALQLVNVLKDAHPDAREGRRYLPRQATLAEVFVLARSSLRVAAEYVEILRGAGAHPGLVAFNALNARLAIDTLNVLRDKGLGSKLSRPHVAGVVAEVMRAVRTSVPLFEALLPEYE